jgi:hypothetical protein
MPGLLQSLPDGVLPSVGLAVKPRVTSCVTCGGKLRNTQENRAPWVYSATGLPCEGSLYRKQCIDKGCATDNYINGYQCRDSPFTILYNKDLAHGKWFAHSRETIIDKKLFKHFDEAFYHSQASFEGLLWRLTATWSTWVRSYLVLVLLGYAPPPNSS